MAITVSDHAVVRYFERVLGFHVETVRWAIEHVCREAVEAGASSVKNGGLTYMIQGNTVTTIIDAPRQNRRSGNREGGGE